MHFYVRVVNQMLVWARDPESGVEDDVTDGKVRLPKLGRPVNDILSREEVERLEDTARTERDKLIIRLFGYTGMRVGELVRLRTEDLATRQRKNFLHVRGKGDLDRLVPIIDPALWRRLQRFVRGPAGSLIERSPVPWAEASSRSRRIVASYRIGCSADGSAGSTRGRDQEARPSASLPI